MAHNDFARFNMEIMQPNITLDKLDWVWPPPEFVLLGGHGNPGFYAKTKEEIEALDPDEMQYVMIRLSMSEISDEDAESMTHVARGAEYFYMEKADEPAS